MASPEAAGGAQPKTLYARVTEDLLRRIRGGEWLIGSSMPAEKDLCAQMSVSRHTLRHALKTLQERGIIALSQGSTAKVISSTPPRVYSQDFNSVRDVLRYPRNTVRENHFERYVECDAALQPTLKAPVGSSWYHIGAVRRDEQSGQALAWTDIYILGKFARVTRLKDHAKDMVFEQIERVFAVSIDRAEIEIDASQLAPEHAALLGCAPGSACLVIVRRYFDSDGEPFEVTVTRHPQGRFTFSMELSSVSRSFKH